MEATRTLSLQMSDLRGAEVIARRVGRGHIALTISNERGTNVTLRDHPDVLRRLLDEARTELAGPE